MALVNADLAQCYYYRVLQKEDQFAANDVVEFVHFPMGETEAFRDALLSADIALFYRVPATPPIGAAIAYARALGLPTVYEIDDLIFESAYYPPALESYGGLIDRSEHAGLLTGVPLFRAAMAACDYAVASTPSLARHMEKVVRRGTCFVHRNALGASKLQRMPPLPERPDASITIFYGSGTKAHKSDFETLAMPALLRLLGEHPLVELVLIGQLTLPDSFAPFSERIRQIPLLKDREAYWSLLRTAAINLAVLESGPFNDCKSEIKWLEAAVLGVPSVVSRTATHDEILTDAETACLAADAEEWFDRLDRLVRDARLRNRIAQNARQLALACYELQPMADKLAAWLAGIARAGTTAPASRPADTTVIRRPRPKLLIVNVFFPPQTIGGATRVVRDNVDILIDRYGEAFDLSIFTTFEGHPEPYHLDRYAYRGIAVTRISTPQEVDMDWRWENDKVGALFAEHLARHKPDLVHFHCVQRLTGSVVAATRAAEIPYLVTVHDGWWISDFQFLVDQADRVRLPNAAAPLGAVDETRDLGRSLRRLVDLKELLDGAERVIAVSHAFADIYRHAGVDHVLALPNGLPQIDWQPRIPSPSGRVRLGHIGGISNHKGFHLVQAALKSGAFSHLELTLVDHAASPGTSREEVWGATKVLIIGKVKPEEIAGLYAGLDVLLAPSIWPESYGLVVREALAAGLWAVTSTLGALAEPIEPGVNGFVVDVSNPKPLYDVLAQINADPARFLANPPQLSRWTTPQDQVEGLVDLYRDSVDRKFPGAAPHEPLAIRF
ncbi:glycosyltransferase [Aurantimonas sp. VKM B-3413]|uniref:glycosyltransferase n=1 Tax=Aurantimonas sp. VKM B-3413 TaxID=2779401 RepID=UPI001E5E7CD9